MIAVLARLSSLPSRQVAEGTEDDAKDAMYRALKGVTRYALNDAMNAVLRNKLGHTFFPTPVELRRLCDEAQRPHQEYERRVRLTEEQLRERREYDRIQAMKTPESRARVRAMMQDLATLIGTHKTATGKPLLDPELVAQIPDAPSTFKKLCA